MAYNSSGFLDVSLTSDTITSALIPQCTQSGKGGGTPAPLLPTYLVSILKSAYSPLLLPARSDFGTDKTMLFRVIEMMPRSTGPDQPLRLTDFYPYQLVNSRIAPMRKELSSEFHRSTVVPQEDNPRPGGGVRAWLAYRRRSSYRTAATYGIPKVDRQE